MATPVVMMPEGIANAPWPSDMNYREQWARWRVRKTLAKVYSLATNETVGALPEETHRLLPDVSSNEISPLRIPKLPEFDPKDELPAEMKVCIVGAGAAGLFTAMIFDWLKKKAERKELPDLNISYDIFEANCKERLGGRLYTYRFPHAKGCEGGDQQGDQTGDHEYYDVGAMRFPEIPIMDR